MEVCAVYPGSFDPVTNGHLDVIRRGTHLFSKVLVAVAQSESKSPYFSHEERIRLMKEAVAPLSQVEVVGFSSLLVDLLREQKSRVVIRGLRAVSDFEYETLLAGMNRQLMPDFESVFLMPGESLNVISSSLVREIVSMQGDVSSFVPSCVVDAFKEKRER
jgi:pantetheine-phosphate adenylyltransferase